MESKRVTRIKNLGINAGKELDRQQEIFDETFNLVIGGLEKTDPERAKSLKKHRDQMVEITEAGKNGDFKKMDELTKELKNGGKN